MVQQKKHLTREYFQSTYRQAVESELFSLPIYERFVLDHLDPHCAPSSYKVNKDKLKANPLVYGHPKAVFITEGSTLSSYAFKSGSNARKSFAEVKRIIMYNLTHHIYNKTVATAILRLLDYKFHHLSLSNGENHPLIEELENFITEKATYHTEHNYQIQMAKKETAELKQSLLDHPTSFKREEIINKLKYLNTIITSGGIDFINNVYNNYKKRNLTQSYRYVPEEIIAKLLTKVEFSKKEQSILNYAEKHIPGFINKVVSALVNQTKFLSLSYLVPMNTIITDSEKRMLYLGRRILLDHFFIHQKMYKWNKDKHCVDKSPDLQYKSQFYELVESVLPNYRTEVVPLIEKIALKNKKRKVGLNEEERLIDELEEALYKYKETKKYSSASYDDYKKLAVRYLKVEKLSNYISSYQEALLSEINELLKYTSALREVYSDGLKAPPGW